MIHAWGPELCTVFRLKQDLLRGIDYDGVSERRTAYSSLPHESLKIVAAD